eukprot:358237-Chlamydomonas_euryale.AAC.7
MRSTVQYSDAWVTQRGRIHKEGAVRGGWHIPPPRPPGLSNPRAPLSMQENSRLLSRSPVNSVGTIYMALNWPHRDREQSKGNAGRPGHEEALQELGGTARRSTGGPTGKQS